MKQLQLLKSLLRSRATILTLGLLFVQCIIIPTSAKCEHPDFEGLMELYDAAGGNNWFDNAGWKEGKEGTSCDPCDFNGGFWTGVYCDNGRVVELFLDGFNLNGQLPDLNLTELTWLSVSSNFLNGPLPDFSNLPNLMFLEISFNQFSGTFPNFTNLPILHECWSFQNLFSGPIPDFKNCQELYFLDFSFNKFTGPIPNFELQNMTEMYFIENEIGGTLPTFPGCPNLSFIDLSNNNISGSFPDFGDNPFKENLNLNLFENNISGCYPESICDIGYVELFGNYDLPYQGDVSQFCIGGDPQVGAPCGKDFLGIFGTIDEDCSCFIEQCTGGHPDLEMLLEFYDSFDGDNWRNNQGWKEGALGYLCDPCGGGFAGYPSWHGITCDENFRVSCIDMDGTGNCNFDGFQGNNLSGSLPPLEFDKLELLNLDGNNITGNIPDLSGMPELKKFWARFCDLSGPLPDFSNNPILEELRISYNALNGPLPDFTTLPNLKKFTASRNEFSGCFPEGTCELDVFEVAGNIEMPWEGSFEMYCNGESQIGAPCSNGDPNTVSLINEECSCEPLSSTHNMPLQNLFLYPNPSSDELQIKGCNDCSAYNIIFSDGRVIRASQSGNQSGKIVDISYLPNGVYFLEVVNQQGSRALKRFVKI